MPGRGAARRARPSPRTGPRGARDRGGTPLARGGSICRCRLRGWRAERPRRARAFAGPGGGSRPARARRIRRTCAARQGDPTSAASGLRKRHRAPAVTRGSTRCAGSQVGLQLARAAGHGLAQRLVARLVERGRDLVDEVRQAGEPSCVGGVRCVAPWKPQRRMTTLPARTGLDRRCARSKDCC